MHLNQLSNRSIEYVPIGFLDSILKSYSQPQLGQEPGRSLLAAPTFAFFTGTALAFLAFVSTAFSLTTFAFFNSMNIWVVSSYAKYFCSLVKKAVSSIRIRC